MNKVHYNVLKHGKVVDEAWCYEYQLKSLKEVLKRYKLKVKVLFMESFEREMEV